MAILTQFILRLSFGLALSMALTSPRMVTSGFFRNHLYVLLGLNCLAALVAWGSEGQFPLWPPLTAAVLSYLGAVVWLYEKPRPGIAILAILSAVSLVGAWLAAPDDSYGTAAAAVLVWLDPLTGGLLLGSTIAAMFLGHWYLNTPTMELAPLRRLLLLMVGALLLRTAVAATGLGFELSAAGMFAIERWLFLSLRWLAGLVGVALLTFMTWQTLKIPNTQSATGILYVAVLGTFSGELVAQLLSAESTFPL